MRYVAIRPETRVIEPIEADTMEAALWQIGLKRGEVDHGMIRRARDNEPGIAIVVYEHSLFVDPEVQHFFAFGDRLYAGNALLYGCDCFGTTVDMPSLDAVRPTWFADWHEVDRAMCDGALRRPCKTDAMGNVFWQWPQRPVPA